MFLELSIITYVHLDTCTIMMNDDLEMTYQSTMYMEAYYVELPGKA